MKKRIIAIGLIINLIIIYNTSVHATAYGGGSGSSETAYSGSQSGQTQQTQQQSTTVQTPVQNPHSQGSTTSQVNGGAYGANSSTITPSSYTGPYGAEIGNSPTNPASTGASTGTLGTSGAGASHTPDEIISEAEGFLQQGSKNPTISGKHLEDASSTLYNLLLSIGIFLAVAIGMYLGVKFMMSSAEDKAKIKEALVPYIAGCVVIFTSFAIWRIVILLLRGIA